MSGLEHRWWGHAVATTVIVGVMLAVSACAPAPDDEVADPNVVEIRRLPIDTMSAVLTRSDAQFDPSVSSDGNGSLRVTTDRATVVALYEMGPVDIEDAQLIYQAQVRTADVTGRVYLEMWCHFPGKGAFFSRGTDTALRGTTRWTVQRTPFDLKKGERPENVRLNLVVDGTGTAWIDDIRLLRAPLDGDGAAGPAPAS
jgi:hypothetical protein